MQKKVKETGVKIKKMKTLVFDTGPIISLATNNLLWLLKPLKEQFKGEFCIANAVKKELVDKPLSSKRYMFEALQVAKLIKEGIIEVVEGNAVLERAKLLMELANKCFSIHGNWLRLVHPGEMESLALALHLKAEALVVDERTTRHLVENPKRLLRRIERRFHAKADVNKKNLQKFRDEVKEVKLIRSFEIVTVAFHLGLLDAYLPDTPNPRKKLLESLLWALKLHGCAVSRDEIRAAICLEAREQSQNKK